MPRNDFQCVKCGNVFHVEEGDIIRCPRLNAKGNKRCHGGGRRLPEHAVEETAPATVKAPIEKTMTLEKAPDGSVKLTSLNRASLNKKALELGVKNPQAFETRREVIDAIQTAVR